MSALTSPPDERTDGAVLSVHTLETFRILGVTIKMFTNAKERAQDFKLEYQGSNPSSPTYQQAT